MSAYGWTVDLRLAWAHTVAGSLAHWPWSSLLDFPFPPSLSLAAFLLPFLKATTYFPFQDTPGEAPAAARHVADGSGDRDSRHVTEVTREAEARRGEAGRKRPPRCRSRETLARLT